MTNKTPLPIDCIWVVSIVSINMKKVASVLLAALFLVGAGGGNAQAIQRIGVVLGDGNFYVKEGPTFAGWTKLTSGVDIGGIELVGDRIAVLDWGGGVDDVSIKEPLVGSQWLPVFYGLGNDANKMLVSHLSNGDYRLLVLKTDGSVVMKDGPWNASWWSGTIATGVEDIFIGDDSIGVINSNGDFLAKQLTPGQFSHPNNVSWNLVATDAATAAISSVRVAYIDSTGNLYAKRGGITAQWFNNKAVIYDNAAQVETVGNRLCVIKFNYDAECKQGGLDAPSLLVAEDIADLRLGAIILLLENSGWVSYRSGYLYDGGPTPTGSLAQGAIGIALNPWPYASTYPYSGPYQDTFDP